MKNDPCKAATEYAVRMSKCATIETLEVLGSEIKANIGAVTGWESWLRCEYRTIRESFKKVDITDTLNAHGKKWAKEQGLI